MTSAPALDVDPLLAPLSGENPAGDPHAYTRQLREKLQELRREENPGDFDEATRPAQLKRADWDEVVAVSRTALCEQTKDLRVACHLLEGLARQQGFPGLLEGLTLLRRLVDECWDRINPEIEDGDLDGRADPLANMLDDPSRGMCFPTTVRTLPVLGDDTGGYGLLAWTRLLADDSEEAGNERNHIRAALTVENLQQRRQTMDACLEEVQTLVHSLEPKLGSETPGLTRLIQALLDCRSLIDSELAGAPAEEPAADEATAEGGDDLDSAVHRTSKQEASRAELYAQLSRAAEALRKLEPHSPIPYFVQRAVRLGELAFPELMEQLIRDQGVLSELSREMGVARESE